MGEAALTLLEWRARHKEMAPMLGLPRHEGQTIYDLFSVSAAARRSGTLTSAG
jgi:hypothetical protein